MLAKGRYDLLTVCRNLRHAKERTSFYSATQSLYTLIQTRR
jgi:hypothetical protein